MIRWAPDDATELLEQALVVLKHYHFDQKYAASRRCFEMIIERFSALDCFSSLVNVSISSLLTSSIEVFIVCCRDTPPDTSIGFGRMLL